MCSDEAKDISNANVEHARRADAKGLVEVDDGDERLDGGAIVNLL